MSNLKVCVVMPTYFRQNGSTRELLSRALRNLEAQTYKNFKLFLIGDHYDDNDEFEEICKSYKKDIFYKNNEEHYRCYDQWRDIHVEVVVENINKFPDAAFILTKAKYSDIFLPRTIENKVFYNNYIPKGEDSVHASHVYKLPLLGDIVVDVINYNHTLATKINNKEDGFEDITIPPGDATILNHINSMVLTKEINSLYIPVITVNKVSDQNYPI